MSNLNEQMFRAAVDRWVVLTDEQWEMWRGVFRPKTISANTHLALPGDHVHELVYVTSGLLRYYFIDAKGKENNKAFICEDMFAGPLASATLGMPIYYGIEALEDTAYFCAPFAELEQLYAQKAAFERVGRSFAEMLLMRKELRTRSLLMQTATERFEEFAAAHLSLLERVPQYHIASYLGIAEVSLSRLKRTLNQPAMAAKSSSPSPR